MEQPLGYVDQAHPNLALPTTTTRVVGIPQMVFTNPITSIHGNRITHRPLMSLIAIRGCKSVDIVHSRGGYWKPVILIALIFDHKDGHYVRPNRVALNYPNFKKDVDPNVHVKVFNFVIKSNAETSEKISSMCLTVC